MKPKTHDLSLYLSVAALVGAAALLTSGCAENRARETAGERPVAAEIAPSDRETALAAREQALVELERSLERRVLDLEREIDTLDRRETARVPVEPEPDPFELADDRDVEPLADLREQPRTVVLTVPASTSLALELVDSVSSEGNRVGDPVRAILLDPVMRDGLVAIPAGADVLGQVAEVVPQKKIGGQARLTVAFERIELPSGESIPIAAFLAAEGKHQKKKDAATIGGAAAGGAILGRVLERDDAAKGTVIGAVLGAAIGTAVASSNQGDPAVIETGARTEVVLETPVQVSVVEPLEPVVFARNR